MISFDFETHLISNEQPAPKPVCLSYYDGSEEGLLVGMEDMGIYLKRVLSSNETIVAHNMRFEALVIDKHFPELKILLREKLRKGELY